MVLWTGRIPYRGLSGTKKFISELKILIENELGNNLEGKKYMDSIKADFFKS